MLKPVILESQDAPDWTKYFKLQKVIEHINGSLPPVTAQSDIDLRIIVAHTLIHSSTIHLYLPFVSKDVNLQLLSLDAARAMLTVIQAIRPSRYQYLDPILAVSSLRLISIKLRILKFLSSVGNLLQMSSFARKSPLNWETFPTRNLWSADCRMSCM